MKCRRIADDQPRILTDRHLDDCPGNCPGCWTCPMRHCDSCDHAHVEGITCAACVGKARQVLADIARMVLDLPAEAEVKGIDSEAMNLLGPAADPEARSNAEASYLAGRLPEGWLDANHGKGCPLLRNEPCAGCGAPDWHPLLVLGGDMIEWQAELEHDDDSRITVESALAYLGRNLGYMAQWPHIDFAYTVRRWRSVVRHMEAVLHDGDQVETGAPCMTCERALVRVYAGDPLPWKYRDGSQPRAADDVWACGHCREWRTEDEYRLNVADLHRSEAEWLPGEQMEIRTGIKAGTVRKWAHDGTVAKRLEAGRIVYRVAEVEARRDGSIALRVAVVP